MLDRKSTADARRALEQLDAVTLACHSLFAKPAVDGVTNWRTALAKRAGYRPADCTSDDDEVDDATLAANRRAAIEAAQNIGARAG